MKPCPTSLVFALDFMTREQPPKTKSEHVCPPLSIGVAAVGDEYYSSRRGFGVAAVGDPQGEALGGGGGYPLV